MNFYFLLNHKLEIGKNKKVGFECFYKSNKFLKKYNILIYKNYTKFTACYSPPKYIRKIQCSDLTDRVVRQVSAEKLSTTLMCGRDRCEVNKLKSKAICNIKFILYNLLTKAESPVPPYYY
ncbi:hypothetical protein LMANV2_330097 [Leptospira interrogans serovar Manilae]|uniref:Uncharacterized protein n=1 Tax=Leptospira interrogans serovar Manilae TaxID=214675 RepID=A0AAQ1NXP1_LEPIR|nr:hypothetical protein LMANV2_330097 [Leptospira interrogans serovar Manilae]